MGIMERWGSGTLFQNKQVIVRQPVAGEKLGRFFGNYSLIFIRLLIAVAYERFIYRWYCE